LVNPGVNAAEAYAVVVNAFCSLLYTLSLVETFSSMSVATDIAADKDRSRRIPDGEGGRRMYLCYDLYILLVSQQQQRCCDTCTESR
jgi:hypothetical protein